jgi:hypothetical protein
VHAVGARHTAGLAGVVATAAALCDVSVFAHSADSQWTYPPACCHGDPVIGECEKIPSITVTPGPDGYVQIEAGLVDWITSK